jgi:hypothetical protein
VASAVSACAAAAVTHALQSRVAERRCGRGGGKGLELGAPRDARLRGERWRRASIEIIAAAACAYSDTWVFRRTDARQVTTEPRKPPRRLPGRVQLASECKICGSAVLVLSHLPALES